MLTQKSVTKLLNLIKLSSLTLAFHLLSLHVSAISASEFAPLTPEEIQKLAVYIVKNGYCAPKEVISQSPAAISQPCVLPAGIPIYTVGPKINH